MTTIDTLPGHAPGLMPSTTWVPLEPSGIGRYVVTYTITGHPGQLAPYEPVTVVVGGCGDCGTCSRLVAYIVPSATAIEWAADHKTADGLRDAPLGELLCHAVMLEHPTERTIPLEPRPRLEDAWRVASFLPLAIHDRIMGGSVWRDVLAMGTEELLAEADALAIAAHEKGGH